jgi:HPt (histidine-containing phosphotransfer) domain-containing protein
MTANATKGDREKCLAVGMNDYATKPLDAEVLYDKIAILLSSDSRTLLSKKAIKTEIDTNKKSAIDNIEKCNHLALNQGIIWDKTGFLKRISHNEVLTKQLVNMFIDDMPELINELLQAMNNEFFDEIVTQAHKISGSSKNLGGVNLAKLAQQIEQSAKTQNSEKIKSLKKELSWAFDMLIQTLEKFLSGKVINDQHINEE